MRSRDIVHGIYIQHRFAGYCQSECNMPSSRLLQSITHLNYGVYSALTVDLQGFYVLNVTLFVFCEWIGGMTRDRALVISLADT